jgi:hypothetical protein
MLGSPGGFPSMEVNLQAPANFFESVFGWGAAEIEARQKRMRKKEASRRNGDLLFVFED